MLRITQWFCLIAATGSLWLQGSYLFALCIVVGVIGGLGLKTYWMANWERHQASWAAQQELATEASELTQRFIKPLLAKKPYTKDEYSESPLETLAKPKVYLLLFVLAGTAVHYSIKFVPLSTRMPDLLVDEPLRAVAILAIRLIAIWLCMTGFAGLFSNQAVQRKSDSA